MNSEKVSKLYHNFNLVTFIITYKCPLSCPMCFFASGPDREEVLPQDLALQILEQSNELKIPAIGIAGGEPFLQIDLMCELLKKADLYRMTTIVVTNAFWATSEQEALRKLDVLRKAGLKRIQISLDDQHQQTIPIERIANALRAANKLDFEDIKLLGTSKGNSEKFKYQLFHLEELLGVSTAEIDLIDRARTSHQYYEDQEQIRYSFEELEHAEKLELPIRKPGDCLSEMMLDVNGDIYPCCNNFIGRIGNAYATNLWTMLKTLRNNKYFRMIKEDGPFELAKHLDKTQKTTFRENSYGNWCELCARIFQNESFKDLLTAEHLVTKDNRMEQHFMKNK